MEGIADIVGGIAILVGLLMYAWEKKRIFDRTNSAGLEQFPTFWVKLIAKLGDIALSIGSILFVTGGVVLLAHTHESTWGWIVLLPLYWLLLVGYFPSKSK